VAEENADLIFVRLRPDFLASCRADPNSFKFFVPETGVSAYGRFIHEYTCTNYDPGDYYAMPSGHASLYTYHIFTIFVIFIDLFISNADLQSFISIYTCGHFS
jgi:hypothetical protein